MLERLCIYGGILLPSMHTNTLLTNFTILAISFNSKKESNSERSINAEHHRQEEKSSLLSPSLTGWSCTLIEKLMVDQAIKFPAFDRTRMFIIVFTGLATGHYHELDESSSFLHTQFL